MRYRGSRRR